MSFSSSPETSSLQCYSEEIDFINGLSAEQKSLGVASNKIIHDNNVNINSVTDEVQLLRLPK